MSSLVGNIKRGILCLVKDSPQAMINLGSASGSVDVNGSIRPCICILEVPAGHCLSCFLNQVMSLSNTEN